MDWVIPYGKGRVYATMLGHLWKGKPDEDGYFEMILPLGTSPELGMGTG